MPSFQARLLFILSVFTLASASLLPRQYPYYGGTFSGNNPYGSGGYPGGGNGGSGHGGHGSSSSAGAFFNGHGSDSDGQNIGSLTQSDLNKLQTINFHRATLARTAHAALACAAMVFFFPVGAILVRILPGRVALWGHVLCQMFGFVVYLAAVGLGIYIATEVRFSTLDFFKSYHPIIGLVLFALVIIQPFGGILHHLGYKRTGGRTWVSHLHLWLGRIIITLGIINGGLGLRLAANASKGQIIAYGIVGGVMWLLTMLIGCGLGHFGRGRRARPATNKEFIDGPLEEDEYHHNRMTGAAAVPIVAGGNRRGLFGRSRGQRPVSQGTNVSSVPNGHHNIPPVPDHTRDVPPPEAEEPIQEPVSPIDGHHDVRNV